MAAAFDKLQLGETAPSSPSPAVAAPATPPVVAAPAAPATAPSIMSVLDNAFGTKPAEVASPAVDAEEALPEDVAKASPKAQTSWRQLKEVLKTRTKEVEEAKRELEALKKNATPADDAEIKALRDRVAEQEEILKVSKVEATAEYKEAVLEPLAAIHSTAAKMAEKHGLAARDIAEALREQDPDKQADLLSDLASGLSDFERIRLYELAKENNRVLSLQQRVLSNAGEAMKRIEKSHADAAAKVQAVTSEERAKAADMVWGQLQEVAPLFREQEGNDAWNGALREIQQSVKNFDIDKLDTVDRVRLTTRGAVAPVLLNMLNELHGNYTKVSAELAAIKNASPKVAAQTVSTDSGSAPAEEMTFAQRVKQALG